MKTDLVFIHPNDQKAVYGDTLKYVACEPPFWMAVATAFCVDRGIEVEVIDAEAENLDYDEVARRTIEQSPGLVGIFVTGTNLSASTQKMQGADLTCATLKKLAPDTKVFFWGGHPSALPERTLLENNADYVIKGENFDAIISILNMLENKGKIEDTSIGGVFYRTANGIHSYQGGTLHETKDLPMPAWDKLPMDRYMPHNWHIMGEDDQNNARGRYGVISTSIGCPFSCSFCMISALFGTRKVRFWDSERVAGEVERLVKKYNVKYIKILDENFVLNADYVNQFCDLIIEKKLDINMWAYSRVDTATPQLLEKCKKAGIQWLAYGIESADDNTLHGVDKGQYDAERTVKVMKMTKDAGINIIANFMFGLPDDTMETMEKTYQLSREINPEWINFYVTMPYPGSEDYMKAVERGDIAEDKWIQYAQFSYECLPMGNKNLTPEQILKFRDEAFVRFFTDNKEYFDNIKKKFGEQYVNSIKNMTKTKRHHQYV